MPASPPAIAIQLSASSLEVLQNGTPASVIVTVSRPAGNSNPVLLTVLLVPAGVSTEISSPGAGSNGQVTFAAQYASAGSHTVTVQASDGATTASANLTLVIAIVATVGTSTNTAVGANGKLQTFMATSFQPADWSYTFFIQHPNATAPLSNLLSQHIRLQPLDGATPELDANTWNFYKLDAIVQPVLSVGDHSPEFQIAVAPDFMRNPDGSFVDPTYRQFATYCANLVRYYNAGGFTDSNGVFHKSPSPYPITWWGIFNEPNINQLPTAEYTKMYNVVVPAMQAVDPNLKFAAVELADFGTEPETYLPTFVSRVTAQVDALATHYYSTCNQKDSDQKLFDTISGFVDHVNFIYSTLKSNPSLANVPVWVTENNVNADFNKGGGTSACNGTPFVTDLRGTSAYFAAWRPFVFSRFAQARVSALYHWDFNADAQFGEVDGGTANLYRSYWVDYWLARYFTSPPGADAKTVKASETTTVEILAAEKSDGTLVVLVANHAVQSSTDNNGPGDPRTVVLDLSAWGPFSSGNTLTIDSSTDPGAGPSPVNITPTPHIEISLKGYGATFLSLKP